jgi:outer membrane protein TolC
VRNAEDRIRALVNDPALGEENCELLPIDCPSAADFPLSMNEALTAAVQYRPEVNQALKQIQAACVRVNMSKNELMPVLNLVTETYVSGLRGNGNVGGALDDQFGVGEPSYSIGLQFEVPINNRAARARHTRRHMEMRQLQNQYETTIQTLKLETRVAVREVETSFDELDTKFSAMQAMEAKSDYILRRWELLPGESRTGSQVLEDLLAAQSQLMRAENEYLTAMVTYNLSLVNLKRATGMLLQHEQVSIGRTCMNGLPTQIVDKPHIERVHSAPPVTEFPDNLAPREFSAPVEAVPVEELAPEPPATPATQASFENSEITTTKKKSVFGRFFRR